MKFFRGVLIATPISILFWLLIIKLCFGAVYYVDSSVTDTNATSCTPDFTTYNPSTFATTGGASSVFKTIADVNACDATGLPAGSYVYFRKGQTWREQLTVPNSGTAGNRITFGAYGSGANPIISGADLATSWSSESVSLGTTVTDNFNRDDENPLGNGDWTTVTNYNALKIVSNQVTGSTGSAWNGSRWSGDTIGADQYAQIKGTNSSFPATGFAVIVRCAAAATTYYRMNMVSSTVFRIHYVINNAAAVQIGADYAYTYSQNMVFKLEVSGQDTSAVLTPYINGVAQATRTGVAGINSGSPGVISYGTAPTLDDFEGGDVGASSFTAYYKTGFSEPDAVFEDSIALTKAVSKVAMVAGTWFWDSGTSRVYIRCTGDADPATKTIEIPQRTHCITSNKDYITYQDLTLEKSDSIGLGFSGTANIVERLLVQKIRSDEVATGGGIGINWTDGSNHIIRNNTVYDCEWGITSYITDTKTSDGVIIEYNTVYECEADGIAVTSQIVGGTGSYSNYTVRYNTSHSNGQTYVYGHGFTFTHSATPAPSGNIMYGNLAYNNGTVSNPGIGFSFQGGASNCTFAYNIGYGNYGTCMLAYEGSDNKIYNNTCYNNGLASSSVAEIQLSSTTGTLVKNNIFYGTSGKYLLVASAGDLTNNTLDYNIYYGGKASPFGYSGADHTFAQYRTDSSQDTHGYNSDPLFTNAAGGDFYLLGTSPARDAGTDVSLTNDYAGRPIYNTTPDIGALEFGKGVWTLAP